MRWPEEASSRRRALSAVTGGHDDERPTPAMFAIPHIAGGAAPVRLRPTMCRRSQAAERSTRFVVMIRANE